MPKVKKLSLPELQQRFGGETQCREFLYEARWSKGFISPKCGASEPCKLANGRIQCAQCHHQTTVTAGTILHRSHMPLTKWFLAMYFASQDKRGISAMQLQAMIGVTYKTAW